MGVGDAIGNRQASLGGLTWQPRVLWKQVAIVFAVFTVLAGVSAVYYKHTFDSLWERESLDVAQIARCIAEGEGFTTLFLRPFNAALLAASDVPNLELNHGPLYPYAVAMAFKLRSPADQVVAWVSLVFLLATLVAVYFLGKVIFDWRTGLLAASAVGLSAPILKIATLGQAWTMASFFFTTLLIFVALHHRAAMAERALAGAIYTAGAAVCCVLLYMTHHLFILFAVPTAVYFAIAGSWRKVHLPVFLTVLVVLAAPWAYRNYLTTGVPILGVNAWDLLARSNAFPGDVLYRSTTEDTRSAATLLLFPIENFSAFARKLVGGSSDIATELIKVMGIGIAGFLIVSTLYRFRDATANAVRGLVYALLPCGVIIIALYSLEPHAVAIFAPVGAVYAAAYLLLLLEAKKLHQFYKRVLIGCFLFLAGYRTIPAIFWQVPVDEENTNRPAHVYFSNVASRGMRLALYTDAPWIAAWRARCWAAWVPISDADFDALDALGFPRRVIVLTPESNKLPQDEIWYVLHRVRTWREYLADPNAALKHILEVAQVNPNDAPAVQRYIQRLKREFAVSAALEGFKPQPQDPLSPDDIQIFTRDE